MRNRSVCPAMVLDLRLWRTFSSGILGWLLLCIVSGTTLLACHSPSVGAHESRIVFRPIGTARTPPECLRPYVLTVFESGLIQYEGLTCVRELGVREIRVEPKFTQQWIAKLLDAGFLDLPYETNPGLQDASMFELELVAVGRNNRILAPYGLARIPRPVHEVHQSILNIIDPVNRWACIAGRWAHCSPVIPAQK